MRPLQTLHLTLESVKASLKRIVDQEIAKVWNCGEGDVDGSGVEGINMPMVRMKELEEVHLSLLERSLGVLMRLPREERSWEKLLEAFYTRSFEVLPYASLNYALSCSTRKEKQETDLTNGFAPCFEILEFLDLPSPHYHYETPPLAAALVHPAIPYSSPRIWTRQFFMRISPEPDMASKKGRKEASEVSDESVSPQEIQSHARHVEAEGSNHPSQRQKLETDDSVPHFSKCHPRFSWPSSLEHVRTTTQSSLSNGCRNPRSSHMTHRLPKPKPMSTENIQYESMAVYIPHSLQVQGHQRDHYRRASDVQEQRLRIPRCSMLTYLVALSPERRNAIKAIHFMHDFNDPAPALKILSACQRLEHLGFNITLMSRHFNHTSLHVPRFEKADGYAELKYRHFFMPFRPEHVETLREEVIALQDAINAHTTGPRSPIPTYTINQLQRAAEMAYLRPRVFNPGSGHPASTLSKDAPQTQSSVGDSSGTAFQVRQTATFMTAGDQENYAMDRVG
ncbi:hypothetical protein DL98DRAFT_655930 [Cadophora sp. DSE1049]|nr:hypothetical protein DL98DRAFT_655930 [Cadophora sp. DSE1049]